MLGMIIKGAQIASDDHEDSVYACHEWHTAMQMGKLADFVGGQGKKGGKRWRLVFTAGSVAHYNCTLHCVAPYTHSSEALLSSMAVQNIQDQPRTVDRRGLHGKLLCCVQGRIR